MIALLLAGALAAGPAPLARATLDKRKVLDDLSEQADADHSAEPTYGRSRGSWNQEKWNLWGLTLNFFFSTSQDRR
jgi:hypothetical protein